MKRILALLLALLMLLALTACGKDEEGTPTGESTAATTNTTESTNDATDGTEDSTQGTTDDTTEGTTGGETTENTGNDNTTSTNGNDKYGSVGMTNAFVDNRQPGVQDSFVATPPQYTKDEFVAKLMAYINSHSPNESYYYGESDKVPKDEKKYVEEYYIKDFSENHEFNLFLHKTNSCEDRWLTIEKWDYQFTDQVVYNIGVSYTITCNTLAEAIAYAKNDAYRMAPFCELSSSQVVYTLWKQGKVGTTLVSKLTDTDFEKLVNGEYTAISAHPEAGLTDGYTCSFSTQIYQLPNGQYEYHGGVGLQIVNK